MFNNNLCSSSLHGRDLINAVVARWLDGMCQRLLATALKVQHCWTLKTTVGDSWRQSPTCAGDSRQLKYKHARDCRRLSPSLATVSDCRRLKYKPGLTLIYLNRQSSIDQATTENMLLLIHKNIFLLLTEIQTNKICLFRDITRYFENISCNAF